MANTICFDINGERHCSHIPVLVDRNPFDDQPDPRRVELVMRPGDDGWLTDVATINTAAQALAGLHDAGLRERLGSVLGEAARAVVPDGVQVDLEVPFAG